MVLRQNGQYYGLFTFVEDTDDQFLMVRCYSSNISSMLSLLPCPALPCPALPCTAFHIRVVLCLELLPTPLSPALGTQTSFLSPALGTQTKVPATCIGHSNKSSCHLHWALKQNFLSLFCGAEEWAQHRRAHGESPGWCLCKPALGHWGLKLPFLLDHAEPQGHCHRHLPAAVQLCCGTCRWRRHFQS